MLLVIQILKYTMQIITLAAALVEVLFQIP